jgi:hypothetical protein
MSASITWKTLFLDKVSLNSGAYKGVEENNEAAATPVLKKEK